MDSNNIRQIEQALEASLPEDYKRILLQYPREIPDARDLHLSDDVDWLIEQNLYVRQEPSGFFGKREWFDNHYIVGSDGNGNCFYLGLERPLPSPIFFLDHERPDVTGMEIASNFDEWIPKIREQLDEYQRNAKSLKVYKEKRAAQATKPWYKFW